MAEFHLVIEYSRVMLMGDVDRTNQSFERLELVPDISEQRVKNVLERVGTISPTLRWVLVSRPAVSL